MRSPPPPAHERVETLGVEELKSVRISRLVNAHFHRVWQRGVDDLYGRKKRLVTGTLPSVRTVTKGLDHVSEEQEIGCCAMDIIQ